MKRSKKYAKIKSKKADRELVLKCNKLINEIIELGEIDLNNLLIVLCIRTGKKKEELNLAKMSDKDLEKLYKELQLML
jgi:hypothetical protein